MSLQVNFVSLLIMLVSLSPFFLSVFLVLESFARNSPLQGFLYILGLMFIQSIGYLSRPFFGKKLGYRPDVLESQNGEKITKVGRACELIPDPWNSGYSCPSFHGIFHLFTIIYVFYNDFVGGFSRNTSLLIAFFIFAISDFIFRLKSGCTTAFQYLMGIIFGLFGAIAWFNLIKSIAPEHTYRSHITDKKSCKFSNQNFDCKLEVYEFDENKQDDGGRKLGDNEIKELTPNDWKNAMANMSLDSKVKKVHSHELKGHSHTVNVTGLNRQTTTSEQPKTETLPDIWKSPDNPISYI